MGMMHKKIITIGVFSFALLMQSSMTSHSRAQSYSPDVQPIEDVTVNIEQIPPQPTQATIPETQNIENSPVATSAPVSTQTDTTIVSPPSANVLTEPKIETAPRW